MRDLLNPSQYNKRGQIEEIISGDIENYRILADLQAPINELLYSKMGEIQYGKLPAWIKPALIDHDYPDSSIHSMFGNKILTIPSLFDHWGRIKGKEEVFFAHPYEEKVDTEDIIWLVRWTKKNGFKFLIKASSFYFPSRTLLILILDK
jgi:hypothetical protein